MERDVLVDAGSPYPEFDEHIDGCGCRKIEHFVFWPFVASFRFPTQGFE